VGGVKNLLPLSNKYSISDVGIKGDHMTKRSANGPAVNINDTWRIAHTHEQGTNRAHIDVPVTEEWQVLSVFVTFSSGVGVAGNRNITLECTTPSRPIYIVISGVVQAANKGYSYIFAPGVPNAVALGPGDTITSSIPTTILGPGDIIEVYDIVDVDKVGDTMEFDLQYAYRSIE
jgi:hypothetical protein